MRVQRGAAAICWARAQRKSKQRRQESRSAPTTSSNIVISQSSGTKPWRSSGKTLRITSKKSRELPPKNPENRLQIRIADDDGHSANARLGTVRRETNEMRSGHPR